MNPQFRNPPPGSNDPTMYEDPVTIPSGDIAENPYWKRDVRRSYPRLSVVRQPDVVALLTVGSAKSPKDAVLQIGDAGSKQLVEVKEEGEKGLAAFFEKNKKAGVSVLGPNGLPPTPTTRYPTGPKRYEMLQEQAYPSKCVLPCFEHCFDILIILQVPMQSIRIDLSNHSPASSPFVASEPVHIAIVL